jgi:hypothetical protein
MRRGNVDWIYVPQDKALCPSYVNSVTNML